MEWDIYSFFIYLDIQECLVLQFCMFQVSSRVYCNIIYSGVLFYPNSVSYISY